MWGNGVEWYNGVNVGEYLSLCFVWLNSFGFFDGLFLRLIFCFGNGWG